MVRHAPALLAACALAGVQAAAAPAPGEAQRNCALVLQVLRGPSVPFSGEQRSEVAVPGDVARTVVRVSGNGAGWVRREYVSGPASGLVTLTHEHTVWERSPDGTWTVLRGPSAQDAGQAAAAICRNYRVTVGSARTVAGRRALPVMISRTQPFNPSRHLTLDPSTGIVLRDAAYAPDGRRRSLSEFTSVRIGPQPPANFRPPEGARVLPRYGPDSLAPRSSAAEVERATGRKVALPAYVPRGYRVVLYGVVQAGNGRLMPAVRYSDGLAAFTVFQRGATSQAGARPRGRGGGRGRGWMGGRRSAATPAPGPPRSTLQASVVVAEGAQASYVLIGDLSEAELARIAKSLP